jgi:hypothetical protein
MVVGRKYIATKKSKNEIIMNFNSILVLNQMEEIIKFSKKEFAIGCINTFKMDKKKEKI